jgi:outer membrane protein
MKNLSLVLNAVLLALVGYLYYVHFSGKKADPAASAIVAPPSMGDGVKIAYVNIDTLNDKYEWLNAQRKALEQKLKEIQGSLAAEGEALAKEYQRLEQKAETTPPAQMEIEGQAFMKKKQAFDQKQERLGKKLSEEEIKTNGEMMANLEAQLKSLQSQIGYDYILSYSKGGGQVLLANDSLEITKQVLDLLNAKKQ